jgi:hypothetical protein
VERRITRHAARLAAQDTGPDADFRQGQRVRTADGIAGTVAAVEPGFSPGSETYSVTLDGGMGGGSYSPGQLRAVAAIDEVTADIDGKLASDSYPEMGTILHDRPDPGREITVIGMRKQAASQFHQQMDPFLYRGLNVELPPDVHAKVHDSSRPEHERGFHLARYLLTHPHPFGGEAGEGLGRDWYYDSHKASEAAEQRMPWSRNLSSGRDPKRTPVVVKAYNPELEHLLKPEEMASYTRSRNWSDVMMPEHGKTEVRRAGSPVEIHSLWWNHPEHLDPGSLHYGEEGELQFPEPIRVKAGLSRSAADQGEMERHLTLPAGNGGHGMPPEIMRAFRSGGRGLEDVHSQIHAKHDFGEHELSHHHGGPSAWEYGADAAGTHAFTGSRRWIPADPRWEA